MRIALLPLVALLVLASARSEAGSPASEVTVSVDLTPAGAIKTFRPDEALGAGIDGAQKGDRTATITSAAQQDAAAARILDFIHAKK